MVQQFRFEVRTQKNGKQSLEGIFTSLFATALVTIAKAWKTAQACIRG